MSIYEVGAYLTNFGIGWAMTGLILITSGVWIWKVNLQSHGKEAKE